jgi:hypothetical protein
MSFRDLLPQLLPMMTLQHARDIADMSIVAGHRCASRDRALRAIEVLEEHQKNVEDIRRAGQLRALLDVTLAPTAWPNQWPT